MKENGKFIYFGKYPQSLSYGENNANETVIVNGQKYLLEEIKWRVLKKYEDKVLLFSEYVLDSKVFSKDTNEYDNSFIRNWLNNDFINKAFTETEKEMILTTYIENKSSEDNPLFSSDIDLDYFPTNDKIFLLSIDDITNEEYGFPTHQGETSTRIKKATDYAVAKGYEDWYYLRTPSSVYPYKVSVVAEEGDIYWDDVSHNGCGVAMAMWIKL